MQLANEEAQRLNHGYIGTEHVLLGLVNAENCVAANVLKNLGVNLRRVRLEVERLVKRGPDTITIGKLPQTPRTKKTLEYAMDEAIRLNRNHVNTEHILLGLLLEREGVAAQVLTRFDLTLKNVRPEVAKLTNQVSPKTLPTTDLQNDLVLLKVALGDPSLTDVDAIRRATQCAWYVERKRKELP
jgi:ATP-dependent Clp protease ATP-binding subunit ClpC